LKAFVFHGGKDERPELRQQIEGKDVIITTYEMCIIEKSAFNKRQWEYIIIDEAHRIKNESSSLSKVVRTFNARHRLLITGTPLQNNLKELWALLNFLLPAMFHSADEFENWFDVTQEEGRNAIAERLHKVLRPFLLRRLKVDVEKELPPKVETKLFVGLSAMQRAWYTKILSRDLAALNGDKSSKMRLLNIVMQLRKVCNHPYLFQGAEEGPPFYEGEHLVQNAGKMVLLDKLLRRLKKQGSRVLIFSQMTRLLDILEDYARMRQFHYCRIDGSTNQTDRDAGMEAFNAPNSEKFLFLLSTRAGGLGINLQTADTVILYDSDWNPQMDLQAQDRAHRIGQKKQVHVYRFCSEDTIEEKIIEKAMKKLFLDAVVIQKGRLMEKSSSNNLSSEELQAMVRFGASRIFQSKESLISDEDIDALIARGEEKTKEESEKLKQASDNNLLNFSISADPTSLYDFEGKQYDKNGQFSFIGFLEPAKRDRKKNYNENQYYKEALNGGVIKAGKTKQFKPVQRFDFQFFKTDRLEQLERKEYNGKLQLKALKDQAKAIEREKKRRDAEEAREEKRLERQRLAKEAADRRNAAAAENDALLLPTSAEVPASGEENKEEEAPTVVDANSNGNVKEEDDDKEAATLAAVAAAVKEEEAQLKRKSSRLSSDGKKDKATTEEDKEDEEARKLREMEKQAGCLTAAEQREKQELEDAGFGDWRRNHFQAFIRACESFGRKNLDAISMEVEAKTPDEVKRYHGVFFKRYRELKDHEKIMRTIEKGEERIKKVESFEKLIARKVMRHKNPMMNMELTYGSGQRTFSEEEDRWLICMTKQYGYGRWVEIKNEIRCAWLFRFNWFFKSRTPAELKSRVDYLIKRLEIEEENMPKKTLSREKKEQQNREKERAAKRKASQAKAASAVKKQRTS